MAEKKRKEPIVLTFLLILLMAGCGAKTPVAPVSNTISFDTRVGAGAENIVALPVAIEGTPYQAAINPVGGNGPFVCESIPPDSVIIGTITLADNCVIAGNAPALSPGTTHGIYPVRFSITDADNVVSGPFNLALEVVKAEQGQQGAVPPGQQGNRLIEEYDSEDSLSGCTSLFDGKWKAHLTTDYIDAYTGPKSQIILDSKSASIDIYFTLMCAQIYKESSYGPGGIIMEISGFSNDYPDFNCVGCKLGGEELKTVLSDGKEIHAVTFLSGPQPDTYSFDIFQFYFNIPDQEEYTNGIIINTPEQPFTFTSGMNAISSGYSWKKSQSSNNPDVIKYPWVLYTEGYPFDCGYRTLPAVGYDGCREVKSSYTLTKVS